MVTSTSLKGLVQPVGGSWILRCLSSRKGLFSDGHHAGDYLWWLWWWSVAMVHFLWWFPETNMFEPENGWLKDKSPFGMAYIQGRAVSFRGGIVMVIMLVIIYDDYGGDQLPWFTFYGDFAGDYLWWFMITYQGCGWFLRIFILVIISSPSIFLVISRKEEDQWSLSKNMCSRMFIPGFHRCPRWKCCVSFHHSGRNTTFWMKKSRSDIHVIKHITSTYTITCNCKKHDVHLWISSHLI